MSKIARYTIVDTLFNTTRTRVFRAYEDDPNDTVIIRTVGIRGASTSHAARLSFTHDLLEMFDHPNIVKSLEWISEKDAEPALVLEDIKGIDLRQYSSRFYKGQYPVDVFLDIAIQMAEALSVIHHKQVIHKDLHPGNIIVNPETGQVQVIDFGLASLLNREQPALDATDRLTGILGYISPEQTGRMNRVLDYRTDFYTLGVTFYQMLSGRMPFEDNDALALVYSHIAKTQKSVISARDDIPLALAKLVDKCMMKNAEDRYQSALGLKKDLERIQQQLTNDEVNDFELGQNDISDRFEIPQKLYGREGDIDILMRAFNRACEAIPQMLAISGNSGIGKSALVHEVHKPIAKNNGLFISGKFDQFQRNTPYSALQKALRTWIQQKIALPLSQFNALREELKVALGDNARVLIDFMPEFSLILGELPDVAKLGASETQNRFHIVFQTFIQTVTRDQTLTLFIDDIQWADQGTLNLLPLLISDAGSRLLVLLAYRDNEVDEHHQAMQTLNQITHSTTLDGEFDELILGPLMHEEIAELLSDTLHTKVGCGYGRLDEWCSPIERAEEIENLTKLVISKTGGNPFFINELLQTLYNEKLFNFDLDTQCWVWDLREINARGITENIVELMLEKMQSLPEEAQKLVQLGACVGRQFDIGILASLSGQTNKQVSQVLWPALKEGLLLKENTWCSDVNVNHADVSTNVVGYGHGRADTGTRQEPNSTSSRGTLPESYRFLHDRMQQAAYESLSEEERQALHLKLGRLLRENVQRYDPKTLKAETVFAIAEQFNKARTLISAKGELKQLAELNLLAAQKAWQASVWQAAARYASLGIALLESDSWQAEFETTKQLYLLKAECDYLIGEQESSQAHYEALFAEIKDKPLLADICANRLVQCIGRGQWKESIDFGLKGLAYLDIAVPNEDEVERATELELKYLQAHSKNGLIEVDKLPEATNSTNETASKIYPNLSLGYSLSKQPLLSDFYAIKSVNHLLLNGRSDLGAMLLTIYAVYLRRSGQLELAFEQSFEAIKLSKIYHPCREAANSYNTNAILVWYLRKTLQECAELHLQGYELGMASGEIGRSLISLCNSLTARTASGESLREINKASLSVIEILDKKAVFNPVCDFVYKFTQALLSKDDDAYLALNDDKFEEGYLSLINQSIHLTALGCYRVELLFWCEQYELALENCAKTIKHISLWSGSILWVDLHFFYCLLLIRKNERNADEQSILDQGLSQIEVYANLNPHNFEHKHLLLQGELLRNKIILTGNKNEFAYLAQTNYREAIKSAERGGFLQYEALGNQLYAELLALLGDDYLAESLIKRAYRCYKDWGCVVKTNKLKECYPFLKQSTSNTQSLSETVSTMDTSSESKSSSVTLDMFSVIKSTQAIADELELRNLIEKVMQVILENAGAKLALMVIDSDEGAFIEAHIDENQGIAHYLCHQRLEEAVGLGDKKAELPSSIINVTLRSGETVQLHNAVVEGDFTDNDYVQSKQVKSALCLPIIYRDSQIGALYLENNLSTEAFDNKRVDFMQVLLTQAAISFENARLFTEVTELNTDLEKKVEQRTAELSKANSDLQNAVNELDAYTRTVSHDLRAPIRFIRNYTEALLEELESDNALNDEKLYLFKKIEDSTEKMYELVTALLALSHVQQRDVEKVEINLSEVVQRLFSEMRERFPQHNVTAHSIENVKVMADSGMTKSVIYNLLSNAWKYSSKKTEAEVTFGRLQEGEELPKGVGAVPDKVPEGYAVFFVKDNGDGFNMDNAKELFGSFKRMHNEKEFEGTGVGLATVKRVIEKHGGSIWVEAYKGEGATFYFTLPLPT